MKTLAILALCALALTLLSSGAATSAAQSPLPVQSPLPARSPIHPPGLKDCPRACIENVIGVGYPTCNAWCVETHDLDIAPEYISPRRATPTPLPASCDRSGWHRVDDWMGIYPLWTNGASYCVEGA